MKWRLTVIDAEKEIHIDCRNQTTALKEKKNQKKKDKSLKFKLRPLT